MLKEIFDDATSSAVSWAVVAIGGGFVWLIRRVFTNQKQIELLQRDLKLREETRQRDREDLQEVKADVKELGRDIRRIFETHGGAQ
jgi:hypothetical protein